MQLEIDFSPIQESPDDSLPVRFLRFDQRNPHVYENLVALARSFRARRPAQQVGIAMLYEVLRWNYYMNTDSEETYKLSNDFRAFYARKIMAQELDLAGVFTTKNSIADEI